MAGRWLLLALLGCGSAWKLPADPAFAPDGMQSETVGALLLVGELSDGAAPPPPIEEGGWDHSAPTRRLYDPGVGDCAEAVVTATRSWLGTRPHHLIRVTQEPGRALVYFQLADLKEQVFQVRYRHYPDVKQARIEFKEFGQLGVPIDPSGPEVAGLVEVLEGAFRCR